MYYPFGMVMPGRNYTSASGYRYGFNGMEKDDEVKGNNNSYSTEFRQYDPRLGRWLSTDPLHFKFPWQTPYCGMDNNPIILTDILGLSASPVFSEDGELLGTDSEGWGGEAIVMDEKDFEQGMDHDKALEKGTELSKFGEGIRISDADWQTVENNGGEIMEPYVKNNSSKTAYYKPEGKVKGEDVNPGYSNSGAFEISPNSDLYAPVDGVATHKYNDAVFKVLTGTKLEIKMNGDVSAWTNPMVIDGWISKDSYYYENGGILTDGLNDGSWDALYEKATETGGTNY